VRTGFEPAYNGFAKRIAFLGARDVRFLSGETLYRRASKSACPGAVPIGFSNRCSAYVAHELVIHNRLRGRWLRVAEMACWRRVDTMLRFTLITESCFVASQ
jgi:hypothetical protein